MVIKQKARLDVEQVLLHMILISMTLIAISYILFFQEGTSPFWERMILVSRLMTLLFDVVYLFFLLVAKKQVDVPSIKVYLILLYIIVISMLVFCPSFMQVISNAFPWPLTYLVFYSYSRKRDIPSSFEKVLVFCYICICLALVKTIITRFSASINTGPVYYSISYLPLVLLLCKDKKKIVLSSFATILVVLSAKRTGLLALVSGFCIYLILMINQGHSSKDKFRSILKIALVGCLIYFIAGHFMDSYLANVLNRFRAISEDKGSGRLIIWYLIISQFKQAPIGAKIFGHGFHAVPNFIRPFGKYIFAHNSYIEFLYDLGIVGAIILLSVVINMGVFLLRLIRDKYEIALPAAFAFCVILAFSFASYCFEESNYIMPIAMFWGIIRGYYMKNSKERSIGNQVHGDIDNE